MKYAQYIHCHTSSDKPIRKHYITYIIHIYWELINQSFNEALAEQPPRYHSQHTCKTTNLLIHTYDQRASTHQMISLLLAAFMHTINSSLNIYMLYTLHNIF